MDCVSWNLQSEHAWHPTSCLFLVSDAKRKVGKRLLAPTHPRIGREKKCCWWLNDLCDCTWLHSPIAMICFQFQVPTRAHRQDFGFRVATIPFQIKSMHVHLVCLPQFVPHILGFGKAKSYWRALWFQAFDFYISEPRLAQLWVRSPMYS